MPVHPFIVHFGIAFCWLAGILYALTILLKEPIFSNQQVFYLHLTASGCIALAIFSGLSAEEGVVLSDEAEKLLKWHQIWAYVTLWLMGLLAIWAYLRMKRWGKVENALFAGIFLLSCVLMSLGTHMGGKMVYEEGVGVSVNSITDE
ncbi:MAG: DUF2231 domain-containing protein [Bacteroidota bacterium]